MVNKNYILLAGLCSTLALQPAFAQESAVWSGRDMTYRGHSYDALDSAYIPESRMEQQREYLDYKYAFPSKPRNQWELGVNVGQVFMWSDVTGKNILSAPKPLDAMGFGVSIRKAMGYTFSWRLNYNFMNASGFDYRPRAASQSHINGNASTNPWLQNGNYAPGDNVYSNYKFRAHELTLQLVAATNNIKFHNHKNSVSFHVFAGGGVALHQTKVSTLNGNNPYDFSVLDGLSDRKDINSEYKGWLADNEYNYDVVNPNLPQGSASDHFLGDYYINPMLVGGLGMQFKLGNRVSLQIENKVTWTGLDWIDGVALDPTVGGGLSPDKDILNYTSVGLGFNLGSKSNSVAPLWWVNPLNHVYEELAAPRHMILPDVVLADSDGDGVADQFDRCPDTPNGVAVDTKGCPLDTDGDGVPDYKDKEIITPTNCWPVDADGVGKCKCPEDCQVAAPVAECGSIITPSTISFSKNSGALSNSAKGQLNNLASQLNQDPNCKIVIEGNSGNNKVERQRAWDRVNNIINYLSDNLQVNRSRFIFKYTGAGDVNTVNIRAAYPGETGNTYESAPHPHLSK